MGNYPSVHTIANHNSIGPTTFPCVDRHFTYYIDIPNALYIAFIPLVMIYNYMSMIDTAIDIT